MEGKCSLTFNLLLVQTFQHEDASVAMFDHLIKVNDLQSSFDQYGISDTDLMFVKEQIAGPIDAEQCSSQMQHTVSKLFPCVKVVICYGYNCGEKIIIVPCGARTMWHIGPITLVRTFS